MIKFFRKIRQKLLSENKFSKYFIYAIGEIVLVVIGILIALQINNWNEGNKQRAKEVDLVNALILDLDLKLNENISDLEIGEQIIERCNKVKFDVQAGMLVDTSNVKDILDGLASDEWFYVTNTPTYNSIVNSGLWQRLPDSLARTVQSIYDGRAAALSLGFQKHNEYATNCKLNYLAPKGLLNLDQNALSLSKKISEDVEAFQVQLDIYMNGVQRMIRLNTISKNRIEVVIPHLYSYRNRLANNKVRQ